jgi:hypothetical protein
MRLALPLLQVSKVGALECLAHLHRQMGRYLASAAVESMAISSRLGSSKSSCSTQVRLAALSLASAVVEGLSAYDRSAPAVHADAWKLFEKNHKVCVWYQGYYTSTPWWYPLMVPLDGTP